MTVYARHSEKLNWSRVVLLFITGLMVMVPVASGQQLRFSNHREVVVPEYPTLRIGPFYSLVSFSQSAGYRYTRSTGAGTDFLYENERGVIKKEGEEWPLESTLVFRNYLLITEKSDLDASISANYRRYPMETQEDEFNVYFAEEGIFGNLSSELELTPFIKTFWYDNIVYKTDYVDTRGLNDEQGGTMFEYLKNVAGVDMDWRLMKDMNMAISASREDMRPRGDTFQDQEHIAYNESGALERELFPGLVGGVKGSSRQVDYSDPAKPDITIQDYSLYGSAGLGKAAEQEAGFTITEASSLLLSIGTSVGYAYDYNTSQRTVNGEGEESVYEGDTDKAALSGSAALKTRMNEETTQLISYNQGLRGGFNSAFETYKSYGYDLGWKGLAAAASVFSKLSLVEPSRADDNAYRDWVSGAKIKYPLIQYVDILVSSTYSIRENEVEQAGGGAGWMDDFDQLASQNDYSTWVSSIGTAFAITKSIKFNTSVQRIDRISDIPELEYQRDVFSANLLYSHQF